MDVELKEESTNRLSSISSEASSRTSISSGCYNVTVVKKKSLSLSCLPDHIADNDQSSLTLPPNLNAVKPFEENMPSKVVSLAQSLYQTAECLESSDSKYELPDEEDQSKSSGHDQNNYEGDVGEASNDTDPSRKKELELTEINTVTHTFVRISALDILAQFPETETVSETMCENGKHGKLKSVNEDLQEETKDGVDVGKTSSKTVDKLPESNWENKVTSWSTTDDVKKKNKKKGLFNNKKVKNSPNRVSESESTEQLGNQDDGKKEHKTHIRKEKLKSAQSLGWLNIFRHKNSADDEKSKEMRSKKERRPLKKSQSFDTNSLSRNSRLSRMDSIRKVFKKRESVAQVESKPIDNVKCVEISSPILKSNVESKNLVDREVFLRDRSYQMDTTKIKKNRSESQPAVSSSEVNVNNNESTSSAKVDNGESKVESVVGNGFVDPPKSPETEESPVPPARHKHLRMKQRLSIQGPEELLKHDSSEDEIKDDKNDYQVDEDEDNLKSYSKDDVEMKKCPDEVKLNDDEISNTDTSLLPDTGNNIDEPSKEDEGTIDVVFVDQEPVAEPIVNDEQRNFDDNENLGFKFVEGVADDVSPTNDTILSSYQVSQPLVSPQSPGSDEEVFVDCNDEGVSFDSAILVDKSQDTGTETSPVRVKMPAGRSVSDITSRTSSNVIDEKKQKKPNSFSGGRSSPVSNIDSPPAVRSPTTTVRRSVTVFRPFKFELAEPSTLITDMVPVTFPNFPSDRRSQIALELFTTERTYVRGLETMTELFKKPMMSGMEEKDVDKVFSNIDDIFAVNKDLLFLLWEKIKHWTSEQCIAQIFIDMEERFKIYAVYCKNFDQADTFLKKRIKRKLDFDSFLKTCYQDPLCQPGLDLPAYLITVVQRIPRYLLLLKDLHKKTAPTHPDFDTLRTALARMNKVAEYINSQLQEVHAKKAMQELRSTVIGLKAYVVNGRTLLKEAEVCLMNPNKSYKCLLFNDIMVFAVQGPNNRSEIEMTLDLKTLWFEDLKKQDPQTSKCDALELYTPHRPYTMYACSRADKRIWIQKLRTAIVILLYGPDCDDPDGMDISKRKASDTYFDGSVYCGDYVNATRHGYGVMAWPNRTRYAGNWADDERHGYGELTYYTGEKYVGNWVADKKEGRGKQTYVNKDIYEGEWKEGKMHGLGVISFANGDCYEGEMLNNEVEGNGRMTCSGTSGFVYDGEWRRSKRHGRGHLLLPNGDEYEGEMLNDRICGSGKMDYFNGDKYDGEWVNGERHGSGYFKLVNGSVFEGQWNKDFMNGQGKMTYTNGDEYTGTWYQNMRVGKGQLICAHGDTYNGQWRADTMHGKGVMYYKDGTIYDGDWSNGKPCGNGRTTYSDKRQYEGEYLDGFRHGRGRLIYPNNVHYIGEWKWDKFDGSGVFTDPIADYSYTGDWCCGMREGSGIEIFCRTRYEGSWKADMKHGFGELKSDEGHVFKGFWKENRKHGMGIRKLKSGIEETQQWHEGHLIDGGGTVAEDLPPLPRR